MSQAAVNILKVRDVASVLGLSEETVRLWCRTGVLPAYRPRSTKQYLINAEEFEAWLKTRAVRNTVEFLESPRLDEDDETIAQRFFDDRTESPPPDVEP